MNIEQSNVIYNIYIFNTIRFKIYREGNMKGFYSQKKKKKKKRKKRKIIANKLNNHSSVQQSKHYKLQNKTTSKIHNKNIIKYSLHNHKNEHTI